MARCSAVCPSSRRAAITFASVCQSSVFISSLKSASIGVGRTPSKSTRTLSFFFTGFLFGAFELAREKIIHHQRRDVRCDSKILLRIVVLHAQAELIAPINQPRQQFVDPKFLLIRPLRNRVHQPSPPLAEITARLDPCRRGAQLAKIDIVEAG